MKRFLKFALAGTGGFAVQVGAMFALTAILGVNYLIATVIAVEAAILANFAWHQRWTFGDRSGGWLERLIHFNALTAITSIFGSVVLTAFFVETMGLHPVFANIASVAALSLVNFAAADRLVFRAGVLGLILIVPQASFARATGANTAYEAVLQAKTLRDFAKYVANVESRRTREIEAREPFLDIERLPADQRARAFAALKRGEVIVTRGAAYDSGTNEINIDGGLVNHWRGTVFVPKVRLDDLLKVLQEPQADKHKQEDVISSRVVSRDGDKQKVYLRLRRTKFVTVVYDTEYDVEYRRIAADRALSNSISTKVVEIENAGTPKERALPEGNDHGYMWRLNSYWRYKQHEDGVLVEIESLTLSRDLPAIIGPLIRPIVTSTARESMTRTLASVRARFM
ncbi:MAG TPA: GtrA family protein [Vicinamibacterales bacterium]